VPLASVHLRFAARLASADHGLHYLGPTLRGAFGHVLKSTVCQVRHGDCRRCLLVDVCPYPAIFEGRPPRAPAQAWKAPAVPQPFALEVAAPDSWAGEPTDLRWGLRLFGPAAQWSPYVVEAFMRMGRHGVGPRRVPCELTRVEEGATGDTLWSSGDTRMTLPSVGPVPGKPAPEHAPVRWRFETPISLRRNGEDAQLVEATGLIAAGQRRWGLLTRFFGDGGDPGPRGRPRHPPPSAFRVLEARTRPWGLTRFSGRQRQHVQLAGLLGEVVIEGPWAEAGDWMSHAETIHVGKYATFGFGRLTWEVV
jgi:hypothetical protein